MTGSNGKSNNGRSNGAGEPESVFEFPCRFPIKAMGRDENDFRAHVVELISEQVGELAPDDVSVRPSSKGQFMSVTVTFEATSRSQLDAVYRSLTASGRVLFVL